MLARMAVAKAGNFGRSWSVMERPSPLSESSGTILDSASALDALESSRACHLVLKMHSD